jgi:hypothetical protein
MDSIHSVQISVDKISSSSQAKDDFVWGAGNIGAVINRTPRQTFNLLNRDQIRSARKKGGRWVASRAALLHEFGA